MRVAFNIYPLQSAHKKRGIGFYTNNLLENLKKDDRVEIVEFIHLSEIKNVDLIHYPWFDLYFHSLPIKTPFPKVVTIHDVIPLIFKEHYPVGLKGKFNFFLQKIALKNCKAYITDSNSSKKDIVKFLNLNEKQIFSIPLAAEEIFKMLNDTKLLHVKRKFNLPARFMLYVGDANWVKNLPFLIQAFSKLIKILQASDLKLILVGEVFLKNVDNIDHPELETLRMVNKLMKELDLERYIIRVGNIEKDELVGFYNLATVYVQPSFYEGFGLPILEAFSCGTPVICSKGGSLPEVGGDAALYFDPFNQKQFINLILAVLQDRSLQEKLMKLGLRQAERFSWKKCTEETIKIYKQILNEKTY